MRPRAGSPARGARRRTWLTLIEVTPMVNRFTIDDVVVSWAARDTTPPSVRRLGALGSYRTDPYQR